MTYFVNHTGSHTPIMQEVYVVCIKDNCCDHTKVMIDWALPKISVGSVANVQLVLEVMNSTSIKWICRFITSQHLMKMYVRFNSSDSTYVPLQWPASLGCTRLPFQWGCTVQSCHWWAWYPTSGQRRQSPSAPQKEAANNFLHCHYTVNITMVYRWRQLQPHHCWNVN